MNDSKTIKVLRIITLTLTLMLLVFALAKKVGLCASDSNNVSSVSSLPFPVGAGFGNTFTQAQLQSIMQIIEDDQTNSNDSDYVGKTIGVVYLYEYGSETIRLRIMTAPDCVVITDGSDAFTTGASVSYRWGSMNYAGVREVILNASDLSYSGGWWTRGNYGYNTSDWVDQLPNNTTVLKSGNLMGYPIYVYEDILDGNNVFFSMNTHSVGGGLTDYSEEVQNFIDSNVNGVDVSDPANTTNVPSWLQKILSGLGTINNTIGGGFSWVKNGINNIWGVITDFSNSVVDGFERIYNSIVGGVSDIIDTIGDISDLLHGNINDNNVIANAWITGFQNSPLYDLTQTASNMKNVLSNLFNTSAAQTLSFTIPCYPLNIPNANTGASNSVYLFGQSITFDFSWYRQQIFGGRSIYDMVNSTFFTFLYVGFLAALFFKLPSLIHGASGFSHLFYGSYNDGVGNNVNNAGSTKSQYDFKAMEKMLRS